MILLYLEGNDIIRKMLKINDNHIILKKDDDCLGLKKGKYAIYFKFDRTENLKQEQEFLNKEIARLEASIARRRNLLANENYVNKAPDAIVKKERNDLLKEETELANLKSK